MRISDQERREIAAQLRESHDFVSSLPKVSLERNAFDTFERVLECVHYEGGNLFDHLADLIDRPMTRNLSEKPEFVCELCGAVWPYDLGFTHCPECGAEVAE